jgi:O-antigen ligase/polysaccharide polymerase Wzy-like membrane protein
MLCRLICVLLFLAFTAEAPNDTVIYEGHWRSVFEVFGPLFASVPGIFLTPWQMIMVALAPVCVLRSGSLRSRSLVMDAAVLVSLASVALTFLWGISRGGSAYDAYYQLWRFLLGLLAAVMVVAVVRRPRDLKAIGFTVVAAAIARSLLCIYFYWEYVQPGRVKPLPIYMTTHDDSLLFIAAILVLLTYALARQKASMWAFALPVFGLVFYAIVLNNRRLAWLELVLVLALVYLLLPKDRVRRRVNAFLVVAAPVILLYVAVGWGREGAIFEPVRALSTSGSDNDASSLARLEEIRNLMYTLSVSGNPVVGTGWGVPYKQVTSIYTHFGKSWTQYGYTPHNSLMGVVVFSGFVGLFGIWGVVPVTAYLAGLGLRGARGPAERAGAMTAAALLPAYGVQCYGDIGFQSVTCGLLLGIAMGVAATTSVWATRPVPAAVPRPEPRRPVPVAAAPAAARGWERR